MHAISGSEFQAAIQEQTKEQQSKLICQLSFTSGALLD